MRRRKSGKDIVDGLYRQIARAGDDLRKLESAEVDDRRCQSGRHALIVMRNANRLLDGLIGDLSPPERPAKKKRAQHGRDEPSLPE